MRRSQGIRRSLVAFFLERGSLSCGKFERNKKDGDEVPPRCGQTDTCENSTILRMRAPMNVILCWGALKIYTENHVAKQQDISGINRFCSVQLPFFNPTEALSMWKEKKNSLSFYMHEILSNNKAIPFLSRVKSWNLNLPTPRKYGKLGLDRFELSIKSWYQNPHPSDLQCTDQTKAITIWWNHLPAMNPQTNITQTFGWYLSIFLPVRASST